MPEKPPHGEGDQGPNRATTLLHELKVGSDGHSTSEEMEQSQGANEGCDATYDDALGPVAWSPDYEP
jgi:hypothetical protein